MHTKRKPPQLSVPNPDTPVTQDEILFSPGVDTPGHKIPVSVLSSKTVSLQELLLLTPVQHALTGFSICAVL